MTESTNAKSKEMRQGVNVAIGLAVLTAIEFGVALVPGLWPVLIAIGLVKALLVLQYFMHLPRLFAGEASHS